MPATRKARPRRPSRVHLQEWLTHRKMNAAQLADQLDASPGTISKLMRGGQRYNEHWLAEIAFVLDCEVADLFRHPDVAVGTKLLAQMTPETRATALNLLRELSTLKVSS